MEQHYIIVYGINGELINQFYCSTVIVDYPGKPDLLLMQLTQTLANEQRGLFYKSHINASDRILMRSDSLILKYGRSRNLNIDPLGIRSGK